MSSPSTAASVLPAGLRRVGVNAVFLQPRMGGLEVYVKQLLPALARLAPELELRVYVGPAGREVLEAAGTDRVAELVTHPLLGRRGTKAISELSLLGLLASRQVDLLHSVALTAPLRTRAVNVVVLADVTWIIEPEPGEAGTVRLWKVVVPPVARRADGVIAISQASARDVVQHLGVDPARVDVTSLGQGTDALVAPTPEPELRERLALPSGPLVLSVSAKKAHKNLIRLIQAMAVVRRTVPDAVLVLPGNATPHELELRAEADRLGLADAVAFPAWVSDADLEGLYAASRAFVVASTNEGFGLPVLEAMRRGLPVACSNASALPEVAGDAALLFDPYDVEAIGAAVRTLVVDEGERERLVALGLARQATFTWDRCAEQTLAAWGHAWAHRRRPRR